MISAVNFDRFIFAHFFLARIENREDWRWKTYSPPSSLWSDCLWGRAHRYRAYSRRSPCLLSYRWGGSECEWRSWFFSGYQERDTINIDPLKFRVDFFLFYV
jgi:hypothetical protein